MTAQEFNRIIDNQKIIDSKLDKIIDKLVVIKSNGNTTINNYLKNMKSK